MTGVCGGLTIGRYGLRWYNAHRFYWDDAIHLLAYAVLVVHGGTNQVTADAKAQLAIDENSSSHTSTDVLLAQFKYTNHVGTVNNVFLYLVFWIVKVAFLFFYRQLFKSSRLFNRVWWGVLVFTIVTYFIPFAGVLATCAGADTVAAWKLCNSSTQARAIKLEYSCAINVLTDLLIMALPLYMLKDLKMNIKQKVSLALMFSLAIFCVALDILRVVEAVASNQALYTVLEINMVVIISCLPTYRSLLLIRIKQRERKASRYGLSSGRSRRSGSKALFEAPFSRIESESHLDTGSLRDEEGGIGMSHAPDGTPVSKRAIVSTQSTEDVPKPSANAPWTGTWTVEPVQPVKEVYYEGRD